MSATNPKDSWNEIRPGVYVLKPEKWAEIQAFAKEFRAKRKMK